MLGSTRALWRPALITLVLAVLFILFKIADPTTVDEALDDVSRNWVGWGLAEVYSSSDPVSAPVAVGLFEDEFKRDISQEPPTLKHYGEIIDKLVELGASEIVFDMDMRLGCTPHEHQNELVAALKRARDKNKPVIIPFLARDLIVCPDGAEVPPAQLIAGLVASRGAVGYVADDATYYYPLFMAFNDRKTKVFVPSLAWAAYRAHLGLPSDLSDEASPREHELNDDVFPIWRRPISARSYVYCSFAVRQLLAAVIIGESTCPKESPGETKEAQGNLPISDLIDNKIVLIGQAGAGNQDLVDTPFDSLQPGVMLHATVLDNLLRFGSDRYFKNRDGICLSFGRFELRANALYLLICSGLPLLFILVGRVVAMGRRVQPVGEWIEGHHVFVGVATSGGLMLLIWIGLDPLFQQKLSIVNAAVTWLSTYGILRAATLIENKLEHRLESRHG